MTKLQIPAATQEIWRLSGELVWYCPGLALQSHRFYTSHVVDDETPAEVELSGTLGGGTVTLPDDAELLDADAIEIERVIYPIDSGCPKRRYTISYTAAGRGAYPLPGVALQCSYTHHSDTHWERTVWVPGAVHIRPASDGRMRVLLPMDVGADILCRDLQIEATLDTARVMEIVDRPLQSLVPEASHLSQALLNATSWEQCVRLHLWYPGAGSSDTRTVEVKNALGEIVIRDGEMWRKLATTGWPAGQAELRVLDAPWISVEMRDHTAWRFQMWLDVLGKGGRDERRAYAFVARAEYNAGNGYRWCHRVQMPASIRIAPTHEDVRAQVSVPEVGIPMQVSVRGDRVHLIVHPDVLLPLWLSPASEIVPGDPNSVSL